MSPSALKSTLSVSHREGAGALALDYTFTNHDAAPVCLYNRLSVVSADGSSSHVDPNAAYVELEGQSLHVRKMVLSLPPGLQAAERLTPHLCKVEPGASFHERLSFPLPVKVEQPYRLALAQSRAPSGHRVSASRAASATELVFSLGAVLLAAGERLIEVEPGVHRIWPPGPAVDRQVVLLQRIDCSAQPVAVLDYD